MCTDGLFLFIHFYTHLLNVIHVTKVLEDAHLARVLVTHFGRMQKETKTNQQPPPLCY